MSDSPVVSVVVPVHNARATLGLALSSLQQQSWQSWEALLVDDGSTDCGLALAEALGDPRVRVVRQPQRGAAAARNTGLRHAVGNYVAFLDADDFLFPSYLGENLRLLRRSAARTIITNNAYFLTLDGINPRLVRHRYSFPSRLAAQQDAILASNFVSIMSVFPRALLTDVPEFDESLERAEDWDYWIRASYAGWHFIHQRKPLAFINRTQHSLTTATSQVAAAERAILVKSAGTLPLSGRQHTAIARRLSTGEPSWLLLESDDLVKQRRYSAAARKHWAATRMTRPSWPGIFRSLIFRAAPSLVGRWIRRTQGRLNQH
ncbi:glycosyltransferase [Nocardioides massiliensis]|uniref:glycosyltransferase n=1 Tax=Nocardioides massiliensis TaxID=1325935 RepID=UPI000A4A3328